MPENKSINMIFISFYKYDEVAETNLFYVTKEFYLLVGLNDVFLHKEGIQAPFLRIYRIYEYHDLVFYLVFLVYYSF